MVEFLECATRPISLKQLRFSKVAAPELIPIQMNHELPPKTRLKYLLTVHNKSQPRQHIGNRGNTIRNRTWLLDSTKSLCSGLSRQRSSRWLMPGGSDRGNPWVKLCHGHRHHRHLLSSAFRDTALAKVSKPPSGSGADWERRSEPHFFLKSSHM